MEKKCAIHAILDSKRMKRLYDNRLDLPSSLFAVKNLPNLLPYFLGENSEPLLYQISKSMPKLFHVKDKLQGVNIKIVQD
jgi:hypothetical protein